VSDSGQRLTDSQLYRIPLVIGVVGHRDLVANELPGIRAAVKDVLTRLRDADRDVEINLLSSMAEGADLLAADVAAELGIDVIALLPYSVEQCRADLTSESSRATFDRLCESAERLEVPVPPGIGPAQLARGGEARDRQYQRAGLFIARYSSLLIAIWDGQDTDHNAGTARVVDFRRRGLGPAAGDGITTPDLFAAEDNDLIFDIRCARSGAAGQTAPAGVIAAAFVSRRAPLGSLVGGVPEALRTLIDHTGEFNRDVIEFGERIARQGRRLAPPSPYSTPESLHYVDQLFVAADWLGVHFRRCFTRALRARYALWAALAFLLLAFKGGHDGVLGFATIAGVLVLFGLGSLLALWAHRRNWHRRYLDYRALAEGLRVDFYWELAGVRLQFDGEFAHESFLQKQDVELEWIRAAMRAVSLRCALYPRSSWPNGFEHTYAAWVGDPDPVNGSGQLQYYHGRVRALTRRQDNAERLAQVMLVAGLIFAIVLTADAAWQFNHGPLLGRGAYSVALWGMALLTAYGAIFEIYLGEKADRLLIRQYSYMELLFGFAARELRSARSLTEKLEILRSLGHACLAEHAQWILAHRDKRIDGIRW
jgi:hypothetical protein